MRVGDVVQLRHEQGQVIPRGAYTISKINPDGSFHVGGNTAVWPRRIIAEAIITGERNHCENQAEKERA